MTNKNIGRFYVFFNKEFILYLNDPSSLANVYIFLEIYPSILLYFGFFTMTTL